MKPAERIKAPSFKELYILRFMILVGLADMIFFLYILLNDAIIDNPTLYWLLIIALVFTFLKIIHEWYHYFYITVPETPALTKQYTVDIFTTYCAGEPYDMMLETLTAIQAIKYPHNTYLCDEADDPYLKDLCNKLGIHHITRLEKINAKAGNINNALQYATGEICVILDPDHVPFPEFLDPIISHFNDPKVGFVQIVQAYKNFHEGLIAKGAAQQTFQFYGPMMMTMNKYGTVLAIGANCTFRRSALDSIGGHAPGLAEDMHTAMQLHAKGWKSVYVPAVLARGLVPSTISAYYAQQLKWSRGVFELFVTSYFKLFKHFTWRQKLHYGVIPFYYLSGFIFLINFLIPILSLLMEVNPIKMDFYSFALVGLPLVVQIILVRNYVQRWVMEDEERGFHIVGGLLMIGTWWIFIIGILYTIIRKKVPYVPTPKDDTEENNWPLNIPNVIVLAVSLFAIGYGLYTDWNPYTFVMAGLAGINCLILFFNIAASKQAYLRELKKKYKVVNLSAKRAFYARKLFWKMRIRVYAGIRHVAIFLTLITMAITGYLIQARSSHSAQATTAVEKSEIFLNGIFAPSSPNGLSSIKLIESYETHFDIISLYIPWGEKEASYLPAPVIDSIYKNGSTPMITWEPWQNLFDKNSNITEDRKVFKKIAAGEYDEYLTAFANQIRELNHPIFIRFAHEADNPFYPWSKSGDNTPQEFKEAWRYVHKYFVKEGAFNAIWVWNPWKATAVKDYFPGKDYVDWIGITSLNYGSKSPDQKWYSMEELYAPFHKQQIINSGIPVMLAEMGSIRSDGRQNEWFKDAANSISKKFPEIKAFVLFNSGVDQNVPVKSRDLQLDWRVSNPKIILASKLSRNTTPLAPLIKNPSVISKNPEIIKKYGDKFKGIKGINYTKGLNWAKNYHSLRNKEINSDFYEIKQMGFNTIKRYGPDVYDYNIFMAAARYDINIVFGFYVDDNIDFLNDQKAVEKLEKSILKSVSELKGDRKIIAWNLGNTPLQKYQSRYPKPTLLYHQYAYANWLKTLVRKIKLQDPGRPVTVDVEVKERLTENLSFLKNLVPEIDVFGFIANGNSKESINYQQLGLPYFFSKIQAPDYLDQNIQTEGFFIADWQDQERSDLVSFEGLKDNWGRKKVTFYQLKDRLNKNSSYKL